MGGGAGCILKDSVAIHLYRVFHSRVSYKAIRLQLRCWRFRRPKVDVGACCVSFCDSLLTFSAENFDRMVIICNEIRELREIAS